MWDIVIVGAGPAGAVAATVAARLGARVLLLDRARFPRPKLCGDTINPGAIDILRRLHLAGVLVDGLALDGMIITGVPAVTVTARYPAGTCGMSLLRSLLDERLVRTAVCAGAQFAEGVMVRRPLIDHGTVSGVEMATATSGADRIRARVVIAADGHYSRIARALGLSAYARRPRRWALGARFGNVERRGAYGEMHVRRGHYIGVAPLPGGATNVCVVTEDRSVIRHADAVQHVLAADPLLRERFVRAELSDAPVVLGPLAVDARSAGCPGLLLAGDAAGFIDPMTGDGLRFAFRGAELAAQESVRVLEHGWDHAHERLARARRSEFSPKWRFNRTLRALVSQPLAVRVAAAGAWMAPGLLAHAVRYAGDVP